MKRLIFCFFLMIISCSNNGIGSVQNMPQGTLAENESLIYDNYKFSNSRSSYRAGMQAKVSGNDLDSSDICIASCVRRPLQITILPMNAGSSVVLTEIKNALTILKFGVNYSKYDIHILEGTNIAIQGLSTITPDIIVGPFNEKDVLFTQKQVDASHVKVPIVSLASKNLGGDKLYNFGYRAESGVITIMNYAKDVGYKNIVMFAPNSDIGGSSYKMFSAIAKSNKQDISRVEFYEPESDDFTKYIIRLKSASIQTYYQNINTGKIQKDDFDFTKGIVATEGNVVTHSSGNKFYRKNKKIDAIVLDASSRDFKKIYDAIASDESLKDVPIIGSPRIVDGIIELTLTGGYEGIDREIIFPANYERYRDYYEIYKNTFMQAPTRFSATIYETLQYILKTHQIKKIDNNNGLSMQLNYITDGVNGQLTPDLDGKTIARIIGVYSFKNGGVTEVIPQMK